MSASAGRLFMWSLLLFKVSDAFYHCKKLLENNGRITVQGRCLHWWRVLFGSGHAARACASIPYCVSYLLFRTISSLIRSSDVHLVVFFSINGQLHLVRPPAKKWISDDSKRLASARSEIARVEMEKVLCGKGERSGRESFSGQLCLFYFHTHALTHTRTNTSLISPFSLVVSTLFILCAFDTSGHHLVCIY